MQHMEVCAFSGCDNSTLVALHSGLVWHHEKISGLDLELCQLNIKLLEMQLVLKEFVEDNTSSFISAILHLIDRPHSCDMGRVSWPF